MKTILAVTAAAFAAFPALASNFNDPAVAVPEIDAMAGVAAVAAVAGVVALVRERMKG